MNHNSEDIDTPAVIEDEETELDYIEPKNTNKLTYAIEYIAKLCSKFFLLFKCQIRSLNKVEIIKNIQILPYIIVDNVSLKLGFLFVTL